MEAFFSSLTDEQRILFAKSLFSSLGLDPLIHIRTIVDGYIMIKGGGKPKKQVAPLPQPPPPSRPKRVRQRIRVFNVPIRSDDYDDMRQDIIKALGDVVSTNIYADPVKQVATITFDDFGLADMAMDRLRGVYNNVQMLE